MTSLLLNEERTEASGPQPHRRGPMRPDRLLSVRARRSRQLGAHAFRAVDLISLLCVTVITVWGSAPGPVMDSSLAHALPLAVGAVAAARLLRSAGLYALGRHEQVLEHLGKVVGCCAIALSGALGLAWLIGSGAPPATTLAVWAAMIAVALCALHFTWWVFVRRWRAQGWLTPNIVIVGATSHADDLIREAIERRDVNVLGIFDDRSERSPQSVGGVPVLGDIDALIGHKVIPAVDLIVIALDRAATSRVRQIAARLSVLPNRVTFVFDDSGTASRLQTMARLADSPLAPLESADNHDRRAFAKRVQDLAFALPLLVVLSPLMALIALAVRLDSRGPIFFRQRRHGFGNEEIVVWKFRTMRQEDTDHRAVRQVTAGDARVTRVGRLLRMTSLDELPQLLNVVSGEMSIVGPRPHAVGMKTGDVESARLVAEYAHRHRIKPGMTGWAAINGSRGPLHTPDEVSRRVSLDIEYVDTQSFWLDLRIIVLTIPRMLGDRTAIR